MHIPCSNSAGIIGSLILATVLWCKPYFVITLCAFYCSSVGYFHRKNKKRTRESIQRKTMKHVRSFNLPSWRDPGQESAHELGPRSMPCAAKLMDSGWRRAARFYEFRGNFWPTSHRASKRDWVCKWLVWICLNFSWTSCHSGMNKLVGWTLPCIVLLFDSERSILSLECPTFF